MKWLFIWLVVGTLNGLSAQNLHLAQFNSYQQVVARKTLQPSDSIQYIAAYFSHTNRSTIQLDLGDDKKDWFGMESPNALQPIRLRSATQKINFLANRGLDYVDQLTFNGGLGQSCYLFKNRQKGAESRP